MPLEFTSKKIPSDKKEKESMITKYLSHDELTEFVEFVRYLRSPWRIIWNNLLAGIFRGLGFLLGATVVLATIIYVLVTIIGSLPIVGQTSKEIGLFFQDIQQASESLKKLGN